MWGHNLFWMSWKGRQIGGHHPKCWDFEKGQEIRSRMESGKIARFKITEVERPSDPKDQLFIKVQDVGYL